MLESLQYTHNVSVTVRGLGFPGGAEREGRLTVINAFRRCRYYNMRNVGIPVHRSRPGPCTGQKIKKAAVPKAVVLSGESVPPRRGPLWDWRRWNGRG